MANANLSYQTGRFCLESKDVPFQMEVICFMDMSPTSLLSSGIVYVDVLMIG